MVEQGPADAAGLLVGDIIAGFDNRPVQEPEQLVTRLRGDHVGKTVPLTVLRGGTALDVPITIAERRRERGTR